jgi:hypothetical protein
MQPYWRKALFATMVFLVLLPAARPQNPTTQTPVLSATFSPPVIFATHAELFS